MRAIAVLAVVFYHAKVWPFSGGFVGVDVFFVISGFLITSILLPNIQAGRIRLVLFYERRIRRIFPALFAVIGLCFVGSWEFFFADQFESFAKSAIAATLFVSNFFFDAQATGYFAAAVEQSPLLHTWSLAVEEQFYIFYPVSLYLAFRWFGRRAPIAVAAGAILSFIVALWAIGDHAKAAFYLAPPRAWEFLIGCILALNAVPVPTSKLGREIAAGSGLAFIGWSVFAYTSTTPFPGIAALLPCLGAALVIYAGLGGPSLVGQLLQTKPLVWTGLISYSLYLWHWPILVFLRQEYAFQEPGPLAIAGAIGAAFIVSALSWRFVEQPFRRPQKMGRKTIFALAPVTAGVTLLLCAAILLRGGIPYRFPHEIADIESVSDEVNHVTCLAEDMTHFEPPTICRIGSSRTSDPRFLLWGDSHANALMPGLAESARKNGVPGAVAAWSGCPPLLGATIASPSDNGACRQFNTFMIDYIHKNASIRTVFLAARWARDAEGTTYGPERGTLKLFTDGKTTSPGPEENQRVFARGLRRTVDAILKAGKGVVLIGPVPEVGLDVPKIVAMQRLTGVTFPVAPTRSAFLDRQRYVLGVIQNLSKMDGVTAVYPHDLLCGADRCDVIDGTHPLYRDDDHLSTYGAEKISGLFDPALGAIGSAELSAGR